MKSGPQKYPGASTAHWWQYRYGGDAMESNVIVWHTTEGTSLPDYGSGASAPNFTAVPDFKTKRLRWYQHFDFDTSARALVNKAGGVETNTLNVCQVEVVGTCDPSTHKRWGTAAHLYTPQLPDWAVRDLAAFAKWAHDEHGVPLTSGVTFKAYPGSYGSNGVRMSAAQWNGYRGHCGHQHVPENDHGDPGLFPMSAILAAAKGGGTTTPSQEEDPMAGMSHKELAEAVWETDGVFGVPAAWRAGNPANAEWKASSVLVNMGDLLRRVSAKVDASNAAIGELAKALAARDDQVDVDALVARIEAAIEGITVRLDVPDQEG